MVLGLLLISLDVHPKIVAATTGFMLVWIEVGGTTSYLLLGDLAYQHALWFGILGSLGGVTGQLAVRSLVRRTGRPSILVFLLSGIMWASLLIVAIVGVVNTVDAASNGERLWELNLLAFQCQVAQNMTL